MPRIEQIVSFCKVVELGSFTQAAKSLILSQPTVSMQIKSLEEEIGSNLLHRDGQRIVLTEDGKKVFPEFLRISASYEKVQQTIAATNHKLRGGLFIGASSGPAETPLPALLGKFKRENKYADIHLIVGDSSEIIDKVAAEAIELGYVGIKRRDSQLRFEEFAIDNLVLAVSPKHPAVVKKKINIDELTQFPLVLQQAGSGATIQLQEALSRANIRFSELNIFMELGLQSSVKAAVLEGFGATIISELGIKKELMLGELVKIDIEDIDLSRQIYVCRNRNLPLSNLAAEFLEFSNMQQKSISSSS